jgi:hypothetical protein
MPASLRALLAEILDYAGLFPPARLPLETAIRNYARYRGEPESWMLGRFVCPATRLAELSPFVEELFPSGPPLTITALGRGGAIAAEYLEALAADLKAVKEFNGRHGDRVRGDMLELRLSADVIKDMKALLGVILSDGMMRAFRKWDIKEFKNFYEVGLGPDWRSTLTAALRVLPGGFKLRCGGLEAAAFPTVEQVAGVLTACARRNVPFKATAGLHHPIRHFDAQLQTHIHGFLNVFGAGVLAAALGLTRKRVQAIVEDEDPSHFVFTDETFRWKDLSVPVEAIVRARRDRMISFGSCSFDEPRADLRALGLL